MKRKIGILLSILLTLAVLFACTPKEETRTPVKGTESITLTAQGASYSQQFILDFSQESPLYTLEPLTNTDFHSCTSCDQCGYTQIGEENAYKVHNTTHGGFRVTLTTPMKADSLKAMRFTYMANKQAPESELRIYRADDGELSSILNNTTPLGGAENKWRTTSAGLQGFAALADEDGYVRSFQLVMRNKNSATFHIQNLILQVDPEALCDVTITDAVKGEKAAVTAIATKIQEHFTQINCKATITVSCDTYLYNSTKYDGEITYTAKVQLEGKTIEFKSESKVLPKIANQWLSNEGTPYGASQDTDTKWEKNFAESGILTLSKRAISCEEGLDRMEYAVLPQGTDYQEASVQWFGVQQHQFNKKGIEKLFINAFLDYGTILKADTSYTMYVRAVTKSNNYILHIQKKFTYQVYSQEIAQALPAAIDKISGSTLWLTKGKSAQDVLADTIGNKNIVIYLVEQKGYSGSNYQVQLSYADSNFKNYTGEAFTLNNIMIWNSKAIATSAVMPKYPLDGEQDIVITADCIVQYMNGAYTEIIQNSFPSYVNEEASTPPGVQLSWQGPQGTYTVKICKDASMKQALSYQTTAHELEIFNLETGTTYYWQVTCNGIASPIASFTTKALPRYLKIDGVRNIRDIGGYVTTDGKTIKQGLIYRSANFDSITEEGRIALIDVLGLKTDLDLRGASGDVATAPLGSAVQHIQVPIKWYASVFAEDEAKLVGDVFKIFANKENYPIGYHCAIGRDRTGTVSVLLLGLLGVDKETAMREYLMSLHSTAGGYTPSVHDNLYANMAAFIDGLASYGKEGASFQKQVEGYLLKAGVTKDEIKAIRQIMLEE